MERLLPVAGRFPHVMRGLSSSSHQQRQRSFIIFTVSNTNKLQTNEQGFEAFKLGVLIQEMRENQNLTQEQLAVKCGTTKSYISRIENDASDIRLSTLMRIVKDGLGGHLQLNVAF